MAEHPLTGPNRQIDEQTQNYVMPRTNLHAAIAALGLQDDMERIGSIHLDPTQVTITYYEFQDGHPTVRDTEHGRTINSHEIVLTVRDTPEGCQCEGDPNAVGTCHNDCPAAAKA